MSESQKRWVIKNSEGLLKGPYTTEEILHRISRGDFSGEELISKFPGADWYPISKDPQFYDRLLEVLSQTSKSFEVEQHRPKTPPPEKAETTETPQPPPKTETKKSDSTPKIESQGDEDDLDMEEEAFREEPIRTPPPPQDPPTPKSQKSKSKGTPKDIEMVDVKAKVKRRTRKRAWKPALAAIAILIAGFYLLLGEDEITEERIHLLEPKIGKGEQRPDLAKEKIRQGVAEYLSDTFGGYSKAQNHLVQAIEASPSNAEVYALLCLTYYELWPFTFQDSQDIKAISHVTQAAAAVDGTGQHSSTCKVVDLLLKGRYPEARNLSGTTLESYKGQGAPPIPFYYFMAILNDAGGDLNTAIGYLTSAQQQWPQWLKVFVYQAQLFSKLEKHTEAANLYRQVLATSPNHEVAKIELGLLEYKQFRNLDKGAELINSALRSPNKPTRRILSRGYLGLAEIALQKHNAQEALNLARKSFSYDSTNSVAKNLMIQLGGTTEVSKTKFKSYQLIAEGDQYFREGDCNAAQAHYKAAFESDKKNGIAAMKAGQCLWSLSLSTEAIEWMNKAIRADPKLVDAYVTLADYYSQRYNFVAASQILSSGQLAAPKSYEVYRGFAMIDYRRHNPKGAVEYAKQALSIYEMDVESHVILAESYIDLGNFDGAFAHATKAREIDPNHRQAQIVFGRSLAGVKGTDASIDYFNELVMLFPVVTDYRLALGKQYMLDERYSDAQRVFSELSQVDDRSKEAFLWLGKALRAQAKYAEALAAFDAAATLDPADAEPIFQSGMLQLDINKPVEAQLQLQRVLKINKLYPLVHYYLGRAALLLGDTKIALDEAKEERNINPNLAEAYLLAAEAYTLQQQYSLCVGEYQKAIKLRPQSADIYIKIAICYRKADQLDVAIAMLNQAAVQESGVPEIYRELGTIYEIKGEMAEATKAYQQYFVLSPNAPDRTVIEQRFKSLGGR